MAGQGNIKFEREPKTKLSHLAEEMTTVNSFGRFFKLAIIPSGCVHQPSLPFNISIHIHFSAIKLTCQLQKEINCKLQRIAYKQKQNVRGQSPLTPVITSF